MNEELLIKLTKLYVYSLPHLWGEEIEKVVVNWYNYYPVYRVTIQQIYKVGGVNPDFRSRDPICKYILEKCFDNSKVTNQYVSIEVEKPTGHDAFEAILQLQEILEVDSEVKLYDA